MTPLHRFLVRHLGDRLANIMLTLIYAVAVVLIIVRLDPVASQALVYLDM